MFSSIVNRIAAPFRAMSSRNPRQQNVVPNPDTAVNGDTVTIRNAPRAAARNTDLLSVEQRNRLAIIQRTDAERLQAARDHYDALRREGVVASEEDLLNSHRRLSTERTRSREIQICIAGTRQITPERFNEITTLNGHSWEVLYAARQAERQQRSSGARRSSSREQSSGFLQRFFSSGEQSPTIGRNASPVIRLRFSPPPNQQAPRLGRRTYSSQEQQLPEIEHRLSSTLDQS